MKHRTYSAQCFVCLIAVRQYQGDASHPVSRHLTALRQPDLSGQDLWKRLV